MKKYILGLGCRRNISLDELSGAIANFAEGKKIYAVATCDIKADEYALLEYASINNLKLFFYTAEELSNIEVPSPSETVKRRISSSSVAEAAVLLSGAKLIKPKQVYESKIALALGEILFLKGKLSVVGIGSGLGSNITAAVKEAINEADVIAGYKNYISLLNEGSLNGKEIIATGMGQEKERCMRAIERAKEGKKVCIVCSGDAGIYGMSGLILELLENIHPIDFELSFLSGVSSAINAANTLGAPLMNDFAVLSLSDILTPREEIIKKIDSLSEIDLVCAVYNPRSSKRRELLEYTIKKFREKRGKKTAFGMVKNAGKINEISVIGYLEHFPFKFVDMNTIIILGSSKTVIKNGKLNTRRGYKN